MAQVTLTIHGRPYVIDCDSGQERRVQELGRYIDGRVREVAAVGAASAESHLLVLTTLLMADEIFELRETLGNMSRQAEAVRDTRSEGTVSSEEESEILAAIDHLAARIDGVAARLSKI